MKRKGGIDNVRNLSLVTERHISLHRIWNFIESHMPLEFHFFFGVPLNENFYMEMATAVAENYNSYAEVKICCP